MIDEFMITAAGANTSVLSNPDAANVDEGSPVVVSVLANDTDQEGDTLTVTQVTNGANGTVANNGTNVTYIHNGSETTSDSFSCTVGDGNGGSDTATVTVTIAPVNDAPVALPQSVTTQKDVPVAVTLLGSDVDSGSLIFSVAQPPTNGALSGTAPGLTYTPDSGFIGSDSFTFAAGDGTLTSPPATVQITVNSAIVGQVVIDDRVKQLSQGESVSSKVEVLVEDLSGRKVQREMSVTLNGPSAGPTPTPTPAPTPAPTPGGTPQTITLNVSNGWDQKNGKTLQADGKVYVVQDSDSDWWDIPAGYYTSFEFTGPTVPTGATILKAEVYVEHWEEEDLAGGSVQWQVATGSLISPNVVGSTVAPDHSGEENEDTDVWEVCTSVAECTPNLVNDLKLVIENQDSEGKLTKQDKIWLEVTYQ